jgi:iron complex transport system ATP-binding protein
VLELRSVAYGYGDRVDAVHDADLDLPEKSLVALTGVNGSGKSTLLRLIARVLVPSRGAVRFQGRDAREWVPKEYARHVAYLPQEPDVAFPMRAIDVVVSGRAPFLGRFSRETTADYDAAATALDLCDAAHLTERYLDAMSGGERKRVFLARVLSGTPRLILLDEPLAALDLAHVQRFAELLRGIVDRTGCSVLFASHDLNWAAAYSDRMIVMQDGTIVEDGTPGDVLQPDTIRRHFGFDAQTVASGGRQWVVPHV